MELLSRRNARFWKITFFAKKRKIKKNLIFYVGGGCPGPCVLRGILTILGIKKGALLGAILGPSWTLMLRKPYVLWGFLTIFDVSFEHLKNAQKTPDDRQDGSKSTSLGPDSTRSYTPIRTCTLKRIVYLKPPRNLKVSLSAIRPIRPYLPYKSRQRKKRAQTQVDHCKCLLLACL